VRIHPECYPCFLRQTHSTLKLLTQDEEVQEALLKEIMGKLAQYKGEDPPPKVSQIVYGTIARRLGVTDPYREKKLECNRMALELYPRLKEMVRRAPDPLFMAVKVAIAGNIIDFGVGRTFKLETGEALEKLDLVVSHYASFRQDLERARRILYIGDNAGEVVFDRVLIEEMGEKEVIFAVRSVPIINDVTLEDAKEAGIDQAARVIESGSRVPGTLLGESTPEFKDLFFNADMVISKGQGNFETLDDAPRAIYFLLRAKCDVVAQLLGVEVGSTLLIKGGLTLA